MAEKRKKKTDNIGEKERQNCHRKELNGKKKCKEKMKKEVQAEMKSCVYWK